MKKIFFVKMLFIISYLLISGCVHNTPPTIEGIEENYEVYGYQTLGIRVKAKDAEGDPLTIVWTQTAGKPLWKKAPNGFDINLLIPADLGEDQVFEITATVSDGTNETAFSTTLTMLAYQKEIVEEMGDDPCPVEDDCSEDPPVSGIVLDPVGFDRYGVFNALEFEKFEIKMVSEMGAMLVFDESLFINLDIGNETTELVTDMFAVDEANGTLYVKEERLTEFMSRLKRSDEDRFNSTISLYISGWDSLGHSVSRGIYFEYGYGIIKGTLVDKEGKAYRGLEGKSVYLKATTRGGSMGTSLKRGGYSALIGEDGRFEIRNLPVGVYSVLLETQDGLSAVAVPVNINLGAPNADISMEVRDINAPVSVSEPLSNAVNNPIKTQSLPTSELDAPPYILKKHQEYLDSLNMNRLQNSNVNGIDLPLLGTLSVEGGARGVWVSKTKTIDIPKEVIRLKKVYTLTTSEVDFNYRNGRIYRARKRDHWYVDVSSSGKIHSGWQGYGQTGTPWSTGFAFGSATRDVRVNSEPDERSFTMLARAINVEDSLLPTTIKVDVYNAGEELTIEKFRLKEGLGLGRGVNPTGNHWYIGLSSNSHKKWKATVEYAPAKMQLDRAECFLGGGGSGGYAGYEFAINDITIKEQGEGKAELEMAFTGMTALDVEAYFNNIGNRVARIRCEFTATNTENGITANTIPRQTTLLGIGGDKSLHLTPLIHYNLGSNARFSLRDPGGDGWMRKETRKYMLKNPQFIYNDASREHGGCFVSSLNNASYNTVNIYDNQECLKVNDHKGHRDGLSVDIRYPGAKANSQTRNLRATLKQAASNPARAAEVRDWVLTARSGIDNIASDPQVKNVYVAQRLWLQTLLSTGKDEEGNVVSGLSTWETKSGKVLHLPPHHNHIHIEMELAQPVIPSDGGGGTD